MGGIINAIEKLNKALTPPESMASGMPKMYPGDTGEMPNIQDMAAQRIIDAQRKPGPDFGQGVVG